MSLLNESALSAGWQPSASQFFCQLTKDDIQCLSLADFADQPFDELCPSKDCWTDCQDLERLYTPFPPGLTYTNPIDYGSPPNVTLWPLCAAISNITEALETNFTNHADTQKFRTFFDNSNKTSQLWASAATTQCWTDTSAVARNDTCAKKCAAVNLLESHYEPQLAGTRECIHCLCDGIDGLPFGNQDIVGIGVSISYVLQSVLIILCWLALAVNTFRTWRNRRESRDGTLHESRKVFVEAISGFQAAQCYFSIPLAVAAFFSNPFTLDPLNAFGLLPVSINGFLPEILTLMIMNYHQARHWYPFILTYISFILNSVTFWAVIHYLLNIQGQGMALQRPAFESLGGIDSCGGTTGIALCLQFQHDSPPAFLIQKYGAAALLGVRLAPVVWVWCAICLGVLTYFQLQSSELGSKIKGPVDAKIHASRAGPFLKWCHNTVRHPALYYVASAVFGIGLLYQATLFYSFLSLGLVDLQTWTFGQIVAITVWVPPVVDYLHNQFGPKIVQLYTPRINDDSPDLRQPLSHVDTAYPFKKHAYAQAADHDEEEMPQRRTSGVSDMHSDDEEHVHGVAKPLPNEFPLQSRGTRDFEDRRYE